MLFSILNNENYNYEKLKRCTASKNKTLEDQFMKLSNHMQETVMFTQF